MGKIDFNERTIYVKITWDEAEQKKKVFMGGAWGAMEKRDANATAIKTGNGLVVVDVDTRDLTEIDKGIRKQLEKLGDPTVTTARGYHWYFRHKNSPEFVNKASYSKLVDIRSDGGIVFNGYRGKNENIMYKRTGAVYEEMPKKLHRILKDAMQVSNKKTKQRTQWDEIPKGEIHDGMLRYIMKDFYAGLAYDEVIANGIDYVQRYLRGTQREINLMMERVKWGFEKRLENKLLDQKVVKPEDEVTVGDFDEEEVVAMLLSAEKGGVLELEKTMKQIKKKLGISIGAQKEMLKEARLEKSGGIAAHFKGEIVWDSNIEKFVEIREDFETYFKKASFNQTVMSASGFLENADVNELLPLVPRKHVIYNPTIPRGNFIDRQGDDAFNVHSTLVHVGKGKKIPKLIGKILDNLFESEPKAKEEFINWLAVILQTGARTGLAWGFFGASGTGKGFVADMLRSLLGGKNCSMNVSDGDLQSAFSSYLRNVQFVHLNEVASDFHGRHGVAGHIKGFITDPYIRVNEKFMGEVEVENFCNVILNSNKANPLELDIDDRRWNMIVTNTPLTSRAWWNGDISYQKAMSQVSEFGAFLMNYEIDAQRAKRPAAMSVAKQAVIEQTTSTLQQLGNMIRNADLDGLLDMLDIDDSSLNFSESELEWATEHGKWSNGLLKRLYVWSVGRTDLKGNEVRKYFITPYVSPISKTFKVGGTVIRGVTLS